MNGETREKVKELFDSYMKWVSEMSEKEKRLFHFGIRYPKCMQ